MSKLGWWYSIVWFSLCLNSLSIYKSLPPLNISVCGSMFRPLLSDLLFAVNVGAYSIIELFLPFFTGIYLGPIPFLNWEPPLRFSASLETKESFVLIVWNCIWFESFGLPSCLVATKFLLFLTPWAFRVSNSSAIICFCAMFIYFCVTIVFTLLLTIGCLPAIVVLGKLDLTKDPFLVFDSILIINSN